MSAQFNSFMTAFRASRPVWTALFPVKDVFCKDIQMQPQNTMMVDVGGGWGHDLVAFREACPEAEGKLILQEQLNVIEELKASDRDTTGFEIMVHDFFTAQPVKGARIYFLKNILHDWPDKEAQQILTQTKKAMQRGYSKLILIEQILPASIKAMAPMTAGLDIAMMLVVALQERTEQMWKALVEQSGLEIRTFWSTSSGDGVLECM